MSNLEEFDCCVDDFCQKFIPFWHQQLIENSLLSKSSVETHDEVHERRAQSTTLSGDRMTVQTRNNLNIIGSNVAGTQDVNLAAGNQLNLHGSDVVACRDTQLSGQNINITSAENSHTAITKTEQKQSGLTVALSGTSGGALNSAIQTAQAANNESDSRIKAALSGVQAARLADAKGGDDKANNNLIGVSLSYGSQSSRSELKQHQTTQQGSSLMTGDNLTLTAAGTPDQNGDIRIQGGQLQAGKDLQLNASRDIQLASSQNTEQTTGKNSSRGGSLGVGFTAGPGGTGINLSASANYGKGRESGNGVSHNETTLDAGQTVTLNAGRDASLKGAQVSGEQITADVKRHLTLSSEQDSNRYDMKQQNVSAGVSATIGSGGSLNLSASRDKIHSNFDSVQEQTGLFAGKGGYQVKVGEHTQLDGAVIASTADKDKNTLDTGTLGFGDIQNKADFKTEHHSVSVSTGGSAGGMFLSNMAANTLGGANREGHAQSTTHAAVSDGALIIRDKDNQQQDITTLSRDTDHANNALSPIFDKEKEQQRLKQAQLIGEISTQVIDIASTEGDIIATKAAHAKLENISEPDRKAAIKVLEDKGETDITPKLIQDQIYKTAYNQALNESGFGTGGKYHTALQAATAAIQGLAGGNIGQALAGGASPYLAGVIKDLTTDPKTHQVDVVSNTLAHAILGAVAAEVSGNNALAGAAGAAGGELAARELMKHIHGENVKVSDLSEEEKQTISTLSTLAAGLAGGISGDSTGSAVTGAQAGKNAVENNFLTAKDVYELKEELLEAEKTGSDKQVIYDKFKERSEKNRLEGVADNCSHNPGCVVSVWEMMNSGTDAASGLNRTSLFSSLSSEEMAQLNRFVQAENAESAQAIYQSLPDVVKKAVEGKEFAEQFGIMPKVGSSSGIIGLGIAGRKPAAKGTPESAAKQENHPSTETTKVPHNQTVKHANKTFEIKSLPDMHGKEHITAVKGDAKIPVDKVELYMRGKAAGDLDALKKEYNALKDLRIQNQREFAKNPENKTNLSILEKKIHNVERSQEMNKVLNNAGLPDTKTNNNMIIGKLLDSAKDVTPENRKTSVVVSGNNGSVRVYATWTILPDGSKRLATVQTGTFK
ncbi:MULTISPECIES: hemagglutinin repeat-containing protein [unclassified Photorhabdus]|uniref:hemagglutinin repeat-containing protein n=1 Tax=unclassified Photorhabdus TaxID=2620880 RepID=UPI000DD7039E|nr:MULTISPECIES: hemagglutinin repeat-containing protein [unclassified Photorhabdus]